MSEQANFVQVFNIENKIRGFVQEFFKEKASET